jgi:hypothetical protein
MTNLERDTLKCKPEGREREDPAEIDKVPPDGIFTWASTGKEPG